MFNCAEFLTTNKMIGEMIVSKPENNLLKREAAIE